MVDTSPDAQLIVTRHPKTAQYFTEDLGNSIGLDMVFIPEGTFLMGSPEDESDRYENEGPQHEVTVPTFFIGKFPVTQAQWRIVAESCPQVDRELNPDPANFKGDQRPVEQVSWFEAVEFCARLTRKTGRQYRLPSEAEWEYACRAGTTTPFYFGETITTDLANYDGTDNEEKGWKGSYGRGPKGVYREETTEVGSLANANQYGLYDLHGNVWEWCLDHWHGSYEGDPPLDGSPWIFSDEEKTDRNRVLRGGSWFFVPRLCRSACRVNYLPDNRFYSYGFRVVCSAAKDSS